MFSMIPACLNTASQLPVPVVASVVLVVTLLAGSPLTARGADANGNAAGKSNRSAAQSAPQSVALGVGERAALNRSGLIIKLIEVKDGRCRANMRCVWAGHATVTIVVSKPGVSAQSLILGTEAPANLKLPFDARYAGYRLVLTELTPDVADPTPVDSRRVRARIEVSKD